MLEEEEEEEGDLTVALEGVLGVATAGTTLGVGSRVVRFLGAIWMERER